MKYNNFMSIFCQLCNLLLNQTLNMQFFCNFAFKCGIVDVKYPVRTYTARTFERSIRERETDSAGFAPFANTWNRVASRPRAGNALRHCRVHWNFQYCAEGLPWLMRRYGFRRCCSVPHVVTACAPWKCARRHGRKARIPLRSIRIPCAKIFRKMQLLKRHN